MDGQHKKKKPRQRNRPKNKANRLQEAEANHSENLQNDPAQQQEILENNIIDAKITPPVPAPSPSQNEATIMLIQQLLRAKLLKQNASKKVEADDEINAKPGVSDLAKLNVKKSKSKEKLTDSQEDKVEFKADLIEIITDRTELSDQKEKLLDHKVDKVQLNTDLTKNHCKELNIKKSKSKDKLELNADQAKNQTEFTKLNVKKSKSKEKLLASQVVKIGNIADLTKTPTDRKELNVKKSKSKEILVDPKIDKVSLNGNSTKNSTDRTDLSVKMSKSKEKLTETKVDQEKDAFIENLTNKMENMMANNNNTELPQTLIDNLQKLFTQEPISDVESSDGEEEYIEYIYKPRQYFVVSLCNFCKCDLRAKELVQCSRCKMTYYCSAEHMKCDDNHRHLCYALRQVADSTGNHLFYKCGDFTTEQFRSYRIVTIRKVEAAINRPLTATEQEVILFPRICTNTKCREYRFNKLVDCVNCGQVAFCKSNPEHLSKQHRFWCKPYQLFKELIMFQEKFGHLDPSLPTKILKDLPGACSSTRQIFNKLALDLQDQCEYAALSQISTCPLTAWYALKLCDQLKKTDEMTIHLIGAEIEFEVDVLHKWELFFIHITPTVKILNVVFIGPELSPGKISFDQFKKTKCCRSCRKNERIVNYFFENTLYHNYCQMETFLKPDLVCFFNAGLYRSTGYHLEDTWPETILAASNLKVPIVVTAYTEYETPLDMTRIVQESNRRLNVVLPPIINPFASEKPDRNFISDEDAPLMFKNYYCFVVE